MSQAGEDVQHVSTGTVVEPLPGRRNPDTWADLRPAYRWLRGRRPVLLAAIVLIAAQIAWRAQFLTGMYFYRQDFFNLDFAARSSLGWHYLTYIGTGHLMIGERAIIWVLARISLYSWGLATTVTLILLAGAGLAAFAVLRTLFGERPAILVPLAIYLLSPLGIAGLGWWTVALETVPLQLAMCMALNAHIHYLRTSRPRHLAAACGWVVVGMLCFEKGIVVPLLLFAVSSAFFTGQRPWLAGMWRVLRRCWLVWLCYAVAAAGYAIILISSLGTASTGPIAPTSSAVLTFSWGLVKGSLVPAAIGGPWRWWPLPGHAYALALPPSALTWLALAVAAVVVGGSIARRLVAWRAWATLAAWVIVADMLPVIIGRLNWYSVLLALDTRYVADAMPVLMICAGLAFLPIAGASAARTSPARPGAGRPLALRVSGGRTGSRQLRRAAIAALLAVYVVGSIWSASAYQSKVTGQPAASYIANASAAIDLARGGTPVVDTAVPDQVKDSTFGTRAVIGQIRPGKLRWIARPHGTMDGLRIFAADGRLYPMWVYGASSGRGPVRGCWPHRRGLVTVKFVKQPPFLTTVLRIGYLWGSRAPGVVTVWYGPTVHQLTVKPGLHSAYLAVTGTASNIVVAGAAASKLCIGDVEAGNPQPVLSAPALPRVPRM